MENKKDEQKKTGMSRRDFMATTATVAAGLTILPGGVISAKGRVAPSDKLNIAGIGIGGMGKRNLEAMKSENIVALADVDWHYAESTFAGISRMPKSIMITGRCSMRWPTVSMRC